MFYILFDIIILILIGIPFRNFRIGYLLTLCSYLAIPYMVRFQFGGIGISIVDIIPLGLLAAFWVNHRHNTQNVKFPKVLKLYFYVSILSDLILIFFSSGFVPYQIQLINLVKDILHISLFLILGYYAFSSLDKKLAYNLIIWVSIICGLYGILTYIIRDNPYINLLYLLYTGGENLYISFQESVRGILEGRVSGTNVHPLGWGQMWNVLLPFFFIVRKYFKKVWFYSAVIIGVINIVLCGSRAALVGFLIFLFLFYLGEKKTRILKYTFIWLIVGLIFFTIFDNYRPVNQMKDYLVTSLFFWNTEKQTGMDIRGSSIEMRLRQLDVAMDIALKNFGGEGYGYKLYSLDHYSKYDSDLFGLESVLVRELVEQGWLGFIIFLWLYYLLYTYIVSGQNKEGKSKWLACFFSYFICILMTDIQGISWTLFFSLILLYKTPIKNCMTKITML